MKVVKVVQTFKDGILTASKKVVVPDPINPETYKPQNAPRHHRVLNLTDAAQVSFNVTQQSFDILKKEIRSLRRKLVAAERAVHARTKERDSLKTAYLSRLQQVSSLKEQNEDLGAQLFAVTEDLNFLEEEIRARPAPAPSPAPSGFYPPSKPPTTTKPIVGPTGVPAGFNLTKPVGKPATNTTKPASKAAWHDREPGATINPILQAMADGLPCPNTTKPVSKPTPEPVRSIAAKPVKK